MSRESIMKIREAEDRAEALIAQARARAQAMIEHAEENGKTLCAQTEEEASREMRAMLDKLHEKTDAMNARELANADEEIAQIRKNARLNRKVAEKIIIRGLDTKCR